MSGRGKWARPSIAERFMSRFNVNPHTGCWEWTGKLRKDGYAVIQRNGGGYVRASRVALEIVGHDVRPDLLACHRCDNPKCVNPDHLFLGTHADNSRDMAEKGRSTKCERNPQAKLTRQQVAAIKADRETPARQLALAYGVCPKTIRNYRAGRTWKEV